MPTAKRPQANECADFYKPYIRQVKSNDALQVLKEAKGQTATFLKSIPDEKWDFRYAPEKWSLKEVLLHLIDTERIFGCRALRIARNDKTSLPGFDQDDFMPFCDAGNRSPQSIIEEYEVVREATIHLFENMTEEAFSRMGTASNYSLSTRAAAFIIAGHEAHHLKVVQEKYI